MKHILSDIVTLSVVGAVLCSFLSDGSKLKRYAGFCMSVVIIISIISPIYTIFDKIKKIDNLELPRADYDADGEMIDARAWIVEQTDIELRMSICSIARTRYGIPLDVDNISIEYDTESYDSVDITGVVIDTSGIVVIKGLYELRDYLSELLLCECEVIG